MAMATPVWDLRVYPPVSAPVPAEGVIVMRPLTAGYGSELLEAKNLLQQRQAAAAAGGAGAAGRGGGGVSGHDARTARAVAGVRDARERGSILIHGGADGGVPRVWRRRSDLEVLRALAAWQLARSPMVW